MLSGFSSCSVDVADFPECSPIPNFVNDSPPDYGAVCDQFLVAHQQILTHDQWVKRQKLWLKAGNGISCIPSYALGDLKKEIEKLCSVAKCTYKQLKVLTDGIDRMQAASKLALP